jgi:hypothetical protein
MQEIGGKRLNSYFSFAGSPKRRIQIEIAIKDKGIVLRVEGKLDIKKKKKKKLMQRKWDKKNRNQPRSQSNKLYKMVYNWVHTNLS